MWTRLLVVAITPFPDFCLPQRPNDVRPNWLEHKPRMGGGASDGLV